MTNLTTPGQVTLKVAMVAWLGMGIYLGSLAGSGEFSTLKLIVAVIFLVFHVVCFLDKTWSWGFGLCLIDFYLLGFGFKISAIELSLTIALALMVFISWRKVLLRPPPDCETIQFKVLNISFGLFLLYMIGHLVFNHLSPYQVQDYALKNFLRTVIWTCGPMVVLWLLINKPNAARSSNTFPRVLILWTFWALLFNLGVRIYEMMTGAEYIVGESNVAASFIVPVIDAAPNVFALRSLPILGCLIAFSFIGTAWMKTQSQATRLLFTLVIIMSVIGALISSGRVATIIVIGEVLVFLLLRGWIMSVVTFAAFTFLTVVTINIFPGALTMLPTQVQRSVAMLVFTDYSDARAGIDNSSDWRKEVATRAFTEWQTDKRTFWFGRGSFSYTEDDDRMIQRDGYEGMIESSVRRGATHNLVTDLLVVHGLVGLILYFLSIGSLMAFLWKCRKSTSNDEIGRCLANVCFAYLAITFGMALVGGGFLPVTLSWLTGLLVGHLYRLENEDPARRPARLGRQQREALPALSPAALRRRGGQPAQLGLARKI